MRVRTLFFSMVLPGMIMMLCMCKKDDPVVTVTDRQLEKLHGSWQATEVTVDDVVQDQYDNFVLVLAGKEGSTTIDYDVEGRPFVSPWSQSGTLLFDAAKPENTLHREDEVVITYEVTSATLIMSFTFTGEAYVNGRNLSAAGEWEFKFERQ